MNSFNHIGLMIKGAMGAVIEPAARPKKATQLEMSVEGKATEYEDGGQPGITALKNNRSRYTRSWRIN